jgi:hypothetical protein
MNAEADRLSKLKTNNKWHKDSHNIRKLPYFPLMCTDGIIYWCHSVNKVIVWRYKNSDFYLP